MRLSRRLALLAAATAAACGNATIGDPPSGGADDDEAPPPVVADARTPDAPAPELDARGCVDGTAHAIDPLSGTCYVYVDSETTWQTARAICEGIGGHLAVPTSAAEDAILAALPPDPVNLPDAWLGGTDAAQEMVWTWVTGEPFVFENWRDGEPNDGNSDQVAEDCMVLEADNGGLWDDRSCSKLFPFLCELPPG